MIKAAIGLLSTLLVFSLVLICLGFTYLFTVVPLWLAITLLSVYGTVIVVNIVVLAVLFKNIKNDLVGLISDIKHFLNQLKSMSPKDIFKIIIKLLK